MKDPLVVVMAHADAQHIFNRHWPYWAKFGCPILVMCPKDSIVDTTAPVLAIGKKSHHDAMANRRFRELLIHLETTMHNEWLILESDAICLCKDEIPLGFCGSITGNRFENTEPHRFKGSCYLHPPIAFSRDILERLIAGMKFVSDEDEEGFYDRWLGLLCDRSKVPATGWGKEGFSRNTIEVGDISAAVAARKAGACMFHGVKSDAVLKAITSVSPGQSISVADALGTLGL